MALAKISRVRGRGVCVPGDDIDTDRIIPARYLKCVTFDGLGAHAFCDERFDADGRSLGHPLDDPRHRGASILVSGRNFGCGSSREHAPIALGSAGCKVVLAASFARIFFRNSVATGELYPSETVDRLCDVLKTGDVVTVDLDAGTVTVKATGKAYKLKPLGEVRPVVDAGGLFNYARKTGMIPAE
jgi:3-isopropylmalate/(R)-2-methylmalate dehydratase small subunit